jgi:hypothetical protein
MRRSYVHDEFVNDLALAGREGTVADRMEGTAAYNRCRVKTGTLTGVTALEVDHDGGTDTVITTDLEAVDRHFGRESLARIVDLADVVRTHFGGLARVTPLD